MAMRLFLVLMFVSSDVLSAEFPLPSYLPGFSITVQKTDEWSARSKFIRYVFKEERGGVNLIERTTNGTD